MRDSIGVRIITYNSSTPVELKRLQYFVTAAHELSFSGAARKLGVSQPVLSRGIKELEAYLGGELFTRTTTEVSLTKAGEAFLPEADEALLTLDQAILSARQIFKGRDSRLDLGYLAVLLEPFVGPAMEIFRQTFPNVFIRPHEESTQGQMDRLRSGEIDMAIACYYDGDCLDQEFDLFEICEVDMCAIIPKSHPLAREEFVSIKQLEDMNFVTFQKSQFPNCVRATQKYFASQGVPHNPIMEANTLQSMMSSVLAGNSFAIMTLLGKTIAPSCIAFVPLAPEENFKVKFAGVVRRDEKRKAVLAFLQECRRVAETRVPEILSEIAPQRLVKIPSRKIEA